MEGTEGELLYGWCVDTHEPDARVVLEICHEGEPIGTVIADVARADLSDRFRKLGAGRAPADPCHGFVADVGLRPEAFLGKLRARVANTGEYIAGVVTRTSHSTPPAGATSFVFSDGGLRLHGWLGAGRESTVVRAFVGSREIASAVAHEKHPSQRSSQANDTGFVLDLPPSLADGAAHSVRVVDAQGAPLNGSPLTVCCFLEGGKALLAAGHQALLAHVLDSHERYVPRSLSSSYYREWAEAFEQPASPAGSRSKIGVIVTGDSDAAAVKRTCDAIQGQRGVSTKAFVQDARAGRKPASLVEEAARAGCSFVAFVRAGDLLPPHAFATAVEAFEDTATHVAYTDSEYRGVPWFKPAWNLEYALASDCALELMLCRAQIALHCANANPAPANSASLRWSILAHAHRAGPQSIRHVPRVLYTWDTAPGPAEIAERTAAAQDAFRSLEPSATLEASAFLSPDGLFQPRRPALPLSRRERNTSVSLIIPTRDRVELLRRCVESLREHTSWPRLEIIIVDNDSTDPDTCKYLRAAARQGVRVLAYPGAFNFAAMNNSAVQAASGEIVGLVNNDIEAMHEGWLDEIVGQLLRPDVGIVGAKLLWPNGMVQHGGVVLGMGNGASHFGNRLADGDWGDHGRNQLVQQVSAVTAACLFMRRLDFLAMGGMDGKSFPVNFNDVDLCLRMRAQGKAVVWTPHACLLHAESASRGKDEAPQLKARGARELANFRARWGNVLLKDPAYHPSLNLDPHSHAFGGLALPPRDRSPRLASLPL